MKHICFYRILEQLLTGSGRHFTFKFKIIMQLSKYLPVLLYVFLFSVSLHFFFYSRSSRYANYLKILPYTNYIVSFLKIVPTFQKFDPKVLFNPIFTLHAKKTSFCQKFSLFQKLFLLPYFVLAN
jgi:hypothetical protein